jgi:hypothetical protein
MELLEWMGLQEYVEKEKSINEKVNRIIFFAMECKLYFKLNTRHGRVIASIAVMLKL